MHIHILGVCGTFMGGLAALAKAAGHEVTGCDAGIYPPMSDQLRAMGIKAIEGYGADQLALNPDVFVVGNVVSRSRMPNGEPKFPLLEAILDAGVPYTSGPQWLAENILQGRHVLAVAGTHGKTTTSSMLTWILEAAGLKPGFLIGGVPLNFGVSARLGDVEVSGKRGLFVIEADEYDSAFFDKRSKFVHYRPRTAVLNNLEFDHADIFDNVEAIERQFHHLVRTVPAAGSLIVNAESESLQKVISMGCWSHQRSFGLAHGDFGIRGESQSVFDVTQGGSVVGRISWTLGGQHNQLNALAAIAAAFSVGVQVSQACDALSDFQSVKRRMEIKGVVKGITVYDDFAHHPTAIATTLDGLRRQVGEQSRILAIFEPRSNTMKLGAMRALLPGALETADGIYCYTAGLNWDAAQALRPLGHKIRCFANLQAMVQDIVESARCGDHLICMSNGSFGGLHQKLLDALQASNKN